MAVTLRINGTVVPVPPTLKLAGSYGITLSPDLVTIGAVRTISIQLPASPWLLNLLGNPEQPSTTTVAAFDGIPAQLEEDGIDMRIEFAAVLYASTERVELRLYGGSSDFYADIKALKLPDLNLSDLDHTYDATEIQARLQSTSGVLYPIIQYGNTSYGANAIRMDNDNIRPAVYLADIVEAIAADQGYTLAGDVIESAYYLKLVLPFTYAKARVPGSYFDGVGFLVGKGTDQVVAGGATANVVLDTEVSDPQNVWQYDGTKYCLVAPVAGYYKVFYRAVADYSLYWETQTIRLRKDPVTGTDTVLEEYTSSNFGSGITGEYGHEHTSALYYLEAGDKLYLQWYNQSAAPVTLLSGTSPTDLQYRCRIQLYGVDDVTVEYGDRWYVAANLPDMAQTDLLRWICWRFGCFAIANPITKTLTLKSYANVLARIDSGDVADWSAKLDLVTAPVVTLDRGKLAQRNTLTWTEDNTVPEVRGADYELVVDSKVLPAVTELYKAPFAASRYGTILLQRLVVPEILTHELDTDSGVFKTSNRQPRVLVSRDYTAGTSIAFRTTASGTIFSTTDINRPYFVDLLTSWSVGWRYNAVEQELDGFLTLLQNMRPVTCRLRLTAADIHQLDQLQPVWIDRYNCYFLPVRVDEHLYGSGTSDVVTLIPLPNT